MEPNVKALTIRDYLRVIFKHKILFVILPFAILIPVYISLELPTPRYRASVQLLIKAAKPTEADYYKGIMGHDIIMDHILLVKSNIVLNRVVEALKLYQRPDDYVKRFSSPLRAALIDYSNRKKNKKTGELFPRKKQALFAQAVANLSGSISAAPEQSSNIFSISVTDYDRVAAARIANSVSRSYVIFDLEQQIVELKLKYGEKHSTVTQLNNYIKDIEKTLDGEVLPDLEAIGPASIKIIKQATNAGQGRRVNKALLYAVAVFAGIFFSIVFAFTLEYIDQTFKTSQEMEKFFNTPSLGSIPKRRQGESLLISDSAPVTNYVSSLDRLSHHIHLLMNDSNMKSILIADAEASKGTAAIIANIGIYLSSKAGCKVIIIDTNLRAAVLSEIFNIPNTVGLADVFKRKTSFEDAVQNISANLTVLTSGQTELNPITILDSSQMSDIINKAHEYYEIVLINCADIKNYTDAVILSSIVNGFVFVANEGKIKRQIVEYAMVPFKKKNINVNGVIINNYRYLIPEIIYKLT